MAEGEEEDDDVMSDHVSVGGREFGTGPLQIHSMYCMNSFEIQSLRRNVGKCFFVVFFNGRSISPVGSVWVQVWVQVFRTETGTVVCLVQQRWRNLTLVNP